MKKLYRSKIDRTIAGVLSGLGRYLEVDPTVLRLLYIILTAITGFVPGIVAYIIAIIIIPDGKKSNS